MSFLDSGVIRRIRQHHALEHATVTILMRRNPQLELAGGRSTHHGFHIYGMVDTEELVVACQEALHRLQGGEAQLAIHPNCGTNLVTTGTLAGLAALTTTAIGRRQRASLWDQVPAAIMAATSAMIVGRPVGSALQRRVTTLADVENLKLGRVSRQQVGRWIHHFVTIEEST